MTHQPFGDSLRDLRLETAQGTSEAPKIDFPCAYPIKIVGDGDSDFSSVVTAIVVRHDSGFDPASAEVVDSRTGKYQSVRLTMTATGEAQLKALFEELKATGRVHMVI